MYPNQLQSQESFVGVPELQSFTQALSQRPAEYIEDSDDYADPEFETRPSTVSFNANPGASKVINARTSPFVENLQRSSFTELDLMPIRCFGCGRLMRQQAIESSLTSGKSLRQTLDELNYKRICCREQIQTQPSVNKRLKALEERSRIARNLELRNLQLDFTAEVPRSQPQTTSGLIIRDELAPEHFVPTLATEGASIEEVNPLENMDTFTYLQSQIADPNDYF